MGEAERQVGFEKAELVAAIITGLPVVRSP